MIGAIFGNLYVRIGLAALAVVLVIGFAISWDVAMKVALLAGIVAGLVAIFFLASPETLMRIGFRIRVNNNLQLLLLWGLVVVSGIILHFLLGEGAARSHGSDYVQSHYNLYFHGTFQTDRAMRGWRGAIGDTLRMYGWGGWWLLFTGAAIYIPVALREEVAEAWRRAVDAIHRERAYRGGVAATTATAAAAPVASTANGATGGGNAAPTQAFIFVREFLAALVSEVAAKGLVARRT